MDLTKLHGSIEKEKRWKYQSFSIELFDSPGEPNSRRVVDLVKFCPDEPAAHLQYGQPHKIQWSAPSCPPQPVLSPLTGVSLV